MTTFQELGLSQEVLNAITELGFVNPTPIQEKTIPALLSESRDMLGLAQTGTGKTAAFGLPMIEGINNNKNAIQGLVIAPTRELCLQITEDLKKFSKYKRMHVLAVYGGASISQQIRELKKGVHIVVATAGRMIDVIERGAIKLDQVSICVLDEADEMLNMGFKEDIEEILSNTPQQKNTWLFSATMPKEIRQIADQFMSKPIEITIGSKNTGNENIEHTFYLTRSKDRYTTLKRLVDVHPEIFGLIFTRTKADAQEVSEQLMRDGYNADALHGDLSQAQRDKVMARFRSRNIQVLVATDVAARGIDVDDITHVINFSLPDDDESYTHRSGRTARAGKKGTCMNIIHIKEQHRVVELERKLKTKFVRKSVPTGMEVCEAQLMKIIHQIHEVDIDENIIAPYMTKVMEELGALSQEQLIKKLVSAEFSRFLEYYKNAPDLNVTEHRRERGDNSRERSDSNYSPRERRSNDNQHNTRNPRNSNENMTNMHINVGADDGLTNKNLLEVIDSVGGIFKRKIGRIYIKNNYAYFDIESKEVKQVMERVNGYQMGRKNVKITIADGAKPKSSSGRENREYFNNENKSRNFEKKPRSRNKEIEYNPYKDKKPAAPKLKESGDWKELMSKDDLAW